MITSKNSSPSESDPSESGPALPDSAQYPFTEPPGFTETQPLPSGERPVTLGAMPSFVSRHPLTVGIIAATLAVVVVSALTAWGVGTAVATSYEAAASTAVAPAASAPPSSAARKAAKARGTSVRGTIQSIAGSTWTITTRAGATQKFTVGSATHYGTEKAPVSASAFSVGTPVVVMEKSGGNGETAVRVVELKLGARAPSATPTPNS